MRIFAYILIGVSLAAGSIAAITAYVPRLDDVGSGLLSLNAEAGRDPESPEQPLIAPGASEEPVVLTDTLVQRLVEAGVERVRVREFSFGRWEHGWLFLLSVLGLLAGGLIIRKLDKKDIAERLASQKRETETPEYAISSARQEVLTMLEDMGRAIDAERTQQQLLKRIDALHDTHLNDFVAARPVLIGRYGVAGFARIMDSFAAAERQINRAWSAAADEELEESHASLRNAGDMLEETSRRLEE